MNKNILGILALVLIAAFIGVTGGNAAVFVAQGIYPLGVFLGLFWYAAMCGMLVTAEILYREGR